MRDSSGKGGSLRRVLSAARVWKRVDHRSISTLAGIHTRRARTLPHTFTKSRNMRATGQLRVLGPVNCRISQKSLGASSSHMLTSQSLQNPCLTCWLEISVLMRPVIKKNERSRCPWEAAYSNGKSKAAERGAHRYHLWESRGDLYSRIWTENISQCAHCERVFRTIA